MNARRRPNPIQYFRYCFGRPLPPSMRDWVRNDLAGPGATARMMMRAIVPTALILAPFWLLPTTFDVHLTMTLPIFLMLVLFSHSLNKVWRRHMLRMHGLDPELADERTRARDAHIHRDYAERYGPRPESGGSARLDGGEAKLGPPHKPGDQRSDDI